MLFCEHALLLASAVLYALGAKVKCQKWEFLGINSFLF